MDVVKRMINRYLSVTEYARAESLLASVSGQFPSDESKVVLASLARRIQREKDANAKLVAAKQKLGWPVEPRFYIPPEALAFFRQARERGGRQRLRAAEPRDQDGQPQRDRAAAR